MLSWMSQRKNVNKLNPMPNPGAEIGSQNKNLLTKASKTTVKQKPTVKPYKNKQCRDQQGSMMLYNISATHIPNGQHHVC